VDDIGDRRFSDVVGISGSLAGCLVSHSVFMFCGHVGAEKCVCFVSFWFLSPDFEGIVEESGVADIIVAEAKKLRVVNCFIAFSGKFAAITKLKIEIFNRCGRGPLGRHSSVVCREVLGSDCSVFFPEMSEESKRSTTTKFSDGGFQCCQVFFGAAVGYHGDEDDFEFAVCFVFFAFNVESA